MFRNYLLIALRNLKKNPVFSVINVLGLAIGISASLIIFLIVRHDFSYEKFQPNGDRIYRVVTNMNFAGTPFPNSGVPMPLQTAIKTEVTGVEVAAPFHQYYEPRISIQRNDTSAATVFKKPKKIIFADGDYFKLIPHTWLAGTAENSLKEPFKVVLTESRSKQYFPGIRPQEIIGKTLTYDDSVQVTVSGVVQDLKAITDFNFQEFLSYATLATSNLKNQTNWGHWGSVSSSTQLMVKLSPGTSAEKIRKQLADLRKKHAENDNGANSTKHDLQPLSDIHFNSTYDAFEQRIANKTTLYSLILLSVFLLVLGCINFINLTTAQGSQRAKEIGVRKTLGSGRRQLMLQFLSETFVLTLLATIVSALIAPLILNLFKDFVPENLSLNLLRQPVIMLFLLGLIIVVSILSGLYPALVLSGFKPILVLKNQVYSNTGKTRNSWLRQTLTVAQFVIAQVFVIGTFIVSKQISYSINKDLGFNKEAIVFFNTPWKAKDENARFVMAEKLKTLPGVRMVSMANWPPSSTNTTSTTMKFNDGKKEQELTVQTKYADTNYLPLYELRLLAGRNIAASDTARELLINETMARMIGFQNPHKAIGQNILFNSKNMPVVGVLKDFHQKSLHETIKPLSILTNKSSLRGLHIALAAHNGSSAGWKQTLAQIEKEWKKIYPEEEFEYKFFDDSIAAFYEADQKISRLLNWAAGLAILISCLGLLGLVIYSTNQRTKEIGVRRVLGATVAQVVTLISKDFVKLVLIAFVIAAPIAWWGMQKWLENFQYRTTMSWWIFGSAGLLMVVIALITLSFQTIRSAAANPVKSLRSE